MDTLSDFGMIGTAVMGKNLALNVADHGFSVVAWNREQDLLDQVVAESQGKLEGAPTLAALVARVKRPRRIMLMIRAGAPVDSVLAELSPLLEPGDIVIEGGNSWYVDTARRERELRSRGVHFFGVGVSGGEEGARRGPSLMPGGDAGAYEQIRPIFEAIAAKTDAGACVTHCGAEGAGHFVKMVHNGIEYADMQFIAEAYDVLRRVVGVDSRELANVFEAWNRGPLESFLIEITAKVFRVEDPQTGGLLVDQVEDRAGQKGTGRWTAEVALTLGVPIPSIAAAIDARVLSSMKAERTAAARVLRGPPKSAQGPVVSESGPMTSERGQGRAHPPGTDALLSAAGFADRAAAVSAVEDALYASKIIAYAQGMALILAASKENGWGTNLGEVTRIWKGGCIIRARFLDVMRRAYAKDPNLGNLLLDPELASVLAERLPGLRRVLLVAQAGGVPVFGMSASLAYYDSYRSPELPQNLTQAQRDAFGAHTYQRKDDPNGPPIHSEWLK